MKTASRIPLAVSDYVANRFREDFLFDVKEVKQVKGHLYYTIEISKDNYIYTLHFNETGKLIRDESGAAFETDDHDEPGFEDIPE
jgi:hypothetical protein